MKNLSELQDIVSEYREWCPSLQVVETTCERNGYPSQVIPAIIGFDDWDQAELFRDENPDFILMWIDSRDGHSLWHRGNEAIKPMKLCAEDFGGVIECRDAVDALDELKQRIFYHCDTLDEIDEKVEMFRPLIEAAMDLEENQFIWVDNIENENWDVADRYAIRHSYDTHNTELAAICLI